MKVAEGDGIREGVGELVGGIVEVRATVTDGKVLFIVLASLQAANNMRMPMLRHMITRPDFLDVMCTQPPKF